MLSRTPLLALTLLCGLAGCGAAPEDREDRPLAGAGTERALGTPGAHEHGVARMNVAVEQEHLVLELIVPGNSVYGFEGAPRNEEQRSAREQGLRLLRERAAELVRFSEPADCRVSETRLADETVPHDDAADDGHAHDHDHGHGHDTAHDHDHSHDGGHTEVQLEAVVRCARPPAGLIMGVDVSRVLPDVEWVDLQVVSEAQQFGARVPASGYEVRL